jgi:transcriptional regulator with GAF, ATPase, and Fis domain
VANDAKNGGSVSTSGSADPATVFAALAEIIYQGCDPAEVYAAISIAATLVVSGCHHASVLVRRDGKYVTVAASDQIARRVDDYERTTGDGPCVDAIEEETPQIDPDITRNCQWPQLAALLIEDTPVRGVMGFRLLVNQRKSGALNLFSDTANAFTKESAGQAIVLAAFASVAINAIAHGEDAATMRRGLVSNREIGKALGMLMMLHGYSEDEAFTMLRRHSQHLNIKLADVARHVIEQRGQFVSGGEDQHSLGV